MRTASSTQFIVAFTTVLVACGTSSPDGSGGGSTSSATASGTVAASSTTTSTTVATGTGGAMSGTSTASGTGAGPADPNCKNDVKDQDETDVDCGGAVCPACAIGKDCSVDADCQSMDCESKLCATPPPVLFRGTNYAGMEMGYQGKNKPFNEASGPVAGTDYPDYVGHPDYYTRNIDYFASKKITVFRLLFSWEGMQSALMGPIPASPNGNYKAYFDVYSAMVAYATSKGIQVVIEPWEYGGMEDGSSGCGTAGCDTGATYRGQLIGSAAVPVAAFADMWSKMAAKFASNPLVNYGLINEPNFMSTMTWWSAAQAAVTAIRAAGSTQRIFIPGVGYTGATNWTKTNCYGCDTAKPARSNAYGWLNANGVGKPIADPLNKIAVEVHTYVDSNESGSSTEITAVTAARKQVAVAVDEAHAHGYQVYLGEIGFNASVMTNDGHPAPDAWADFINYADANSDTLIGYTWWAAGYPEWWNDVGANGGGHFSISPTKDPAAGPWSGDTVNMTMIEGSF